MEEDGTEVAIAHSWDGVRGISCAPIECDFAHGIRAVAN